MKKINIVAIIVLVVILVVAAVLFYPKGSCQKGFHKAMGVCIYNNIPEGMKYVEMSWFGEDVPRFSGNLSDYLIRNDDPKRISEVLGGDWSSYTCKSSGTVPVIVSYFYILCDKNIDGCGHSRRAVVCGNIYLVQDFTSTYGPRLYGPFTLENN